jgi:Flp pilus assembly protein TadG
MKRAMNAVKDLNFTIFKNDRGVTILLVVLLMFFVIFPLTVLVIDLSHLYFVRNELHNAADAGALAGARYLYNDDGTLVNVGANQIAFDAAVANKALSKSGLLAVDVNWNPGENYGADIDVQRGHWSFASKIFAANDSTAPVDLWNVSAAELDNDPNFINSVRVVARRQTFPATSFFAGIFGLNDFELSVEAVAYIGFAGSIPPEDVDQPIAICRQSILDAAGNYSCATGRMINSGGGTTHNTAAWTNFTQPCATATPPTIDPLICSDGNPDFLNFGSGMGTVGGMQDNVFKDLRDCWLTTASLNNDSRGYPTEPWTLTLPVIDCPANNPSPCSKLVGVVTLVVVWIKQSGTDPHWNDIPSQMRQPNGMMWQCSHGIDVESMTEAQRQECWGEFTDNFELNTADDTPVGDLSASDIQKTMFFLPECEAHEPTGTTGGQNFGILARIPVLVK